MPRYIFGHRFIACVNRDCDCTTSLHIILPSQGTIAVTRTRWITPPSRATVDRVSIIVIWTKSFLSFVGARGGGMDVPSRPHNCAVVVADPIKYQGDLPAGIAGGWGGPGREQPNGRPDSECEIMCASKPH